MKAMNLVTLPFKQAYLKVELDIDIESLEGVLWGAVFSAGQPSQQVFILFQAAETQSKNLSFKNRRYNFLL